MMVEVRPISAVMLKYQNPCCGDMLAIVRLGVVHVVLHYVVPSDSGAGCGSAC